ncbi:CwfJ C-terminus 1-domain-containing protein-like protein [Cokeromyces recurvatus]|uniref:CwfJ C-terminus 1-domain-containing protein-like protein n=1 Tax=Cokeromyces recurvatus TaxID=90255 RepID=UPI002220E228|nr:CwfJ C-terminus 1-domain-containing protein-like protein [Cokeromyces recurvatus]KAI7907479.1 CwfJ C-terminus 1-domain-containing protein-like protein [Cokeromyces recurvatus]
MPVTLPAGVDFLLTYEWPKSISELSSLSPIQINEDKSSIYISELAAALKPRYHFAASQSIFYEREPYKNIKSGLAATEERSAPHPTRFIGLGDVLNKEKQRWFYAFNLVPMSKASKELLETLPENTTECPFTNLFLESNKRKEREEDRQGGGSFFWGEEAKRSKLSNAPPENYICKRCNQGGHYFKDCPQAGNNEPQRQIPPEGYVCRICNEPGHFIKFCPQRMVKNSQAAQPKLDECWFCLSNPKLEKHLIVSIGTELYVTLAKGPVVSSKDKDSKVPGGGHLLVIPVNHYSTFAKIPEESHTQVITELEKYKASIRRLFEKYDQDMVVFEVSRGSSKGLIHAHIQIVPVPKSKSDQLEKIAKEQAALSNITFLDQVPQNPDVPYFKLDLPNGKSLVHVLQFRERFNLQFGRLVIANVLGVPEREDWKACSQTEEEEKLDAEQFKAAFKPFDFSLIE